MTDRSRQPFRPMNCHRTGCIMLQLLWLAVWINTVVGNNPPRPKDFDQFAQTEERAPKGTIISILTATDTDGPDQISFRIDPGSVEPDLVKLSAPVGDSATGRSVNVSLNVDNLDSDYNCDERQIKILMSDGVNAAVSVTILLFIMDINDVAPEFQKKPYRASILENAPIGSLVFNKTETVDPDHGLGGKVTYSLESNAGAYKNTFNATLFEGFIHLYGQLDYEKHNFYQLMLTVTDGGGLNSTTDVIVTVIDVQDTPPFFVNTPYSVTVKEDVTVGFSVISVSALDGDRGKSNPISYRFTGDTYGGIFNIDSTTGLITVAKNLTSLNNMDLSSAGNVFALNVLAEEIDQNPPQKGETTVSVLVIIRLEDINDNAPMFSHQSYQATIAENSQRGIHIQFNDVNNIFVRDLDMDTKNSHFMVSVMKDGLPFDVFSVSPSTVYSSANLNVLVNNNGMLDYEELVKTTGSSSITFQIQAQETGTAERRSGETTLTVNIIDVNENFPLFNQTGYQAEIFENATVNTIVTIISDKDEPGNNALLTYSLGTGGDTTNATSTANGLPLFKIDSNSGMIRVKQPLVDYAGMWYLTVIATDRGAPSNSASATVLVNILDVNNYSPIIDDFDGEIYFTEEPNGYKSVYNFTATDNDKGTFGDFTFHLTNIRGLDEDNAVFKLNPHTGELKTKIGIDYEVTKSFALYIQVRDKGIPTRTSPITIVFIQIVDADDNPPEFFGSRDTPKMFQVTEGFTGVIGRVEAYDRDSANTSRSCYCFIGDHANFSLDIVSGEITLLEKIDRDCTPKPRDLVIRVKQFCNSCDSPKREKRAIDAPPFYDRDDQTLLWVRVNIECINDNKPISTWQKAGVVITQDTQVGANGISLSSVLKISQIHQPVQQNQQYQAPGINTSGQMFQEIIKRLGQIEKSLTTKLDTIERKASGPIDTNQPRHSYSACSSTGGCGFGECCVLTRLRSDFSPDMEYNNRPSGQCLRCL